MTTIKQNFLLSFVMVVTFFFFLMIIFGDKGLADLNMLKKTKESIAEKNESLMQENICLYRSIERLKTDPVFIENVARQELHMIRANELIFKPVREWNVE